jgi:hypothetical protein
VKTAAELFALYEAWKEASENLDTFEMLLNPLDNPADRQKYEVLINQRLDAFSAFERPYAASPEALRAEVQKLISDNYRRRWRTPT